MTTPKKSRRIPVPAVLVVLVAVFLGVRPKEALRFLQGETKPPAATKPVAAKPAPPTPPAGMGIQGVPLPATPEQFYAQLHELDRVEAVPVRMQEKMGRLDPGKLFLDLDPGLRLHPSYDAVVELCKQMDPWDRDDTEATPEAQRALLGTMANSLPIRAALKLAGGDLESLRKVWFGAGRSFEHIFCGESGGRQGDPKPRLGGYHFWYTHYRFEREGRAWYMGSDYRKEEVDRGLGDAGMVTGFFRLDVDGSGPRPAMDKDPRGGFAVGESPAALLALGYMVAKLKPESPVSANLTGVAYGWRYHMDYQDDTSLRTLWPGY